VRSEFYLTPEEKAFFAEKKTVRALCTVDAAPFIFLDQAGAPCGIAVSILEDFAKEVGLTAEYEVFDRREDLSTVLKGGNYDCIWEFPSIPSITLPLALSPPIPTCG
jgi:membrane-bound lytic murein transglycosylase MltF